MSWSAVILSIAACSQDATEGSPGTIRGGGTTPAPSDRVNVLFLCVDDLRTQLGCYGDAIAQTPGIDRLAAGGIVFDRAYCQQALCTPSRSSFLTGLRPGTTGVIDMVTHFRDQLPDAVTLPEHFKNHGYATIGLGKVFHSKLEDPRSWTVPVDSSRRLTQLYALPENTGSQQDAAGRKLVGQARHQPATECADVADAVYADGHLAELAIETLRNYQDQAFFLAVGFFKPHLPFAAPKRYWDLYDRDALPLTTDLALPLRAPKIAGEPEGDRGIRKYPDIGNDLLTNEDKQRLLLHGYLACVSFVDTQIGRILDELERLGLAERTVVVLFSDHAWQLGEHGMWGKNTNYETSTRVPLILRAPGARPGLHTKALVELVDLFPTLCELTGLAVPEGLEGCSMAPLLEDPDRPWKAAAFTEVHRDTITGRSLRTDRFRLVQWLREGDPDYEILELYDHDVDPGETENVVVRRLAFEKDVAAMKEMLRAGWRSALPPAPASEGDAPGAAGEVPGK